MRCSCPQCGTYMVQWEKGANSACICPKCQYICDACMGSGEKMQKGGNVPEYIRLAYENPDQKEES